MKAFVFLFLALLLTASACHRDDDQTIQREEEYDQKDVDGH